MHGALSGFYPARQVMSRRVFFVVRVLSCKLQSVLNWQRLAVLEFQASYTVGNGRHVFRPWACYACGV
jgi:hypothetical protein